ncbi:extensin family protein [Pseudooceanicola sp. C21-150M6]|uniref:extensin-like domain-containing protein n=1 Tax=Pseudooceanicola sp. C21-150M6 TaxID=3434355 RepID=UPI003D7F8C71
MRRALAGAALLLLAVPVLAEVPRSSLRPVARDQLARGVIAQPETKPRPPDRPETLGVTREVEGKKFRLFGALRPKSRTPQIEEQGRKNAAARKRGAVCGDLDIQGVAIGVVGGPGACGVSDAVRVSSVEGVALSTHAVMDCTTAKALKRWIDGGMKPAIDGRGGGVVTIRVAAHYACRNRNNQKGAKLSEHAKGRAIDISGFTLRDGTTITVLDGWGRKSDGRALRQMHRAACGPFGTVLGPEANRFHRDHFHFDTARYRSGSYCR